MKRWFVACGAAALLFFPRVSHAELIRNFLVDIRIDANRTVHVTETIDDDLGEERRTGFVRLIPTTTGYNGVVHSRRVEIEGVTRNGQAVPFQSIGADGYLRIEIQADTELTGVQRYVFSYTEERAIDRVSGHDRLDWEVVGTTWDVPIERAQFQIGFLHSPLIEEIKSACVIGIGSVVDADCRRIIDGSNFSLQMQRILLPEEGMHIRLDIPSGVISKPILWETIRYSIQDHAPFVFPLSAFAVMAIVWWLKGRDPKFETIFSISEPPNGLSPEVLASMVNEAEAPATATEEYAKMFDTDPATTRGAYTLIGLALILGLYAFFGSSGVGVVSAVSTGVIVILFGWFMPRRTVEGTKMFVRILGFKKYLSETKQSPKEFERLLPYAIALGVEKELRALCTSRTSE